MWRPHGHGGFAGHRDGSESDDQSDQEGCDIEGYVKRLRFCVAHFQWRLPDYPDSELNDVAILCVAELARRRQWGRIGNIVHNMVDVIDRRRGVPLMGAAQAGIPVADDSSSGS